MSEYLRVVPDFFAGAKELRSTFDDRFGSPDIASRERFVWDYWHVPNQYTYIRTYAQYYFPNTLYSSLMSRLRSWGRDNLGCGKVTTPWLSYFIDGCRQEFHTDVPHGPWAFVYSLTDWEHRSFKGGETMLLRPACMDFWRDYDPSHPHVAASLIEFVPPHFNQLTVFDPRIPHGVRLVEGIRDPRHSRLVIHGWFREADLIVSDSLGSKISESVFDEALARLEERLKQFDKMAGLLTLRIDLKANGTVEKTTVLSDTLVSTTVDKDQRADVDHAIQDFIGGLSFPPVPDQSWIIIPVRLPCPES
jgi:hypothetical protein